MNRQFKAVCLAIFVHFTLLMAIFEIYYKSPLVHGMSQHGNVSNAPASRLVLFVADGLRAQTFFHENTKAPFLKEIMSKHGSWGTSFSHVPTESRPGHVALLAGFYEDVSAVTKGWRENPVDFDSVLNQSTYTWSWGSPDILPMFAKGAKGDHVVTYTYPSHFEDFVSDDAPKLDTWVFESVKTFFRDTKTNSTLNSLVKSKKVVLFLHLLGTDTIGHGFKPKSPEYVNNVALVDRGIRDIVDLLDEFYGDNKTAYIFTSDHGMTDWGSHGAGGEHEILTPLVAWGSGLKRPLPRKVTGLSSSRNSMDVQQIDLAPLMAALLGLNMPLNSIGTLPIGYLNASDQYKAHVSCANFEAVIEQMNVQRQKKLQTRFRLLFREYPQLTSAKLASIKRQISKLFEQKRYTLATSVCLEWISGAVDALYYYHRYERTFLSVFVLLTYLFWLLYVRNFISSSNSAPSSSNVSNGKTSNERWMFIRNIWYQEKPFIASGFFIILYLWVTAQPLTYYIYCLFPLVLLSNSKDSIPFYGSNSLNILPTSCRWMLNGLLILVAMEILVLSFFYRWSLSIGLIFLSLWPGFSNNHCDYRLRRAWILACLLNSIYPLLPTVGQQVSYGMVSLVAFLVGLAGLAYTNYANFKSDGTEFRKTFLLNVFSTISLCCSFVVLLNSISVETKRGSPLMCRLFSWIAIVAGPILPLLDGKSIRNRSISIGYSLFIPFTLMSVSYEPYFLLSFSFLLYLWLCLEQTGEGNDSQVDLNVEFGSQNGLLPTRNGHLRLDDFRRAYFFVFFLLLGFFGTGNVASLNSFNPSFIYCFVTVFSPFLMGTLLLLKIAIPFLFVCVTLKALESTCSKVATSGSMFWLVVLISDFMALNFFFLLKDSGSWLEIGTSISHYVISMAITVVTILLYGLANFLTTFTLHLEVKRHVL